MPEEKFDTLIGVKCHQRSRDALARIARAKGMESPADLLRLAADAIIEYAAIYGDKALPLDMALTQRISPRNELALAAENPSPALEGAVLRAYGIAPAPAESGVSDAGTLPGSPPSPPESQPTEAPKRGSKRRARNAH